MRLLIFGNMKSTIFNFQLSAIKLPVVRKYEVGSLFADKVLSPSCFVFYYFYFILFFIFLCFLKPLKIVIKKRSGTRSGTLHICGSTPRMDSWKIRKTQENK